MLIEQLDPAQIVKPERSQSGLLLQLPYRRGGRLLELVGSRHDVQMDAEALRRLVPDVRRREVYLCGPEPLTDALASELGRAGVPGSRIHFESFAF